jgi:hypothetical protein
MYFSDRGIDKFFVFQRFLLTRVLFVFQWHCYLRQYVINGPLKSIVLSSQTPCTQHAQLDVQLIDYQQLV